jgi:hypothetical protein
MGRDLNETRNEAKREDEKHHHLARREAFLDTANELMPA